LKIVATEQTYDRLHKHLGGMNIRSPSPQGAGRERKI